MSSNHQDTEDRAQDLLTGFQKHLANGQSLNLASKAYTPAQITAALEQLVSLFTDVDVAKSAVKAKLAARTAQAPQLVSLMAALAAYVKVAYSESPDVLADFGLTPKKTPTPLTTEQKTVAVAKRASTRKARGTTGKKEKMGIVGNVVDVVLTPVTAPSPAGTSSAAPTAPATSGSATGGTTSHGG